MFVVFVASTICHAPVSFMIYLVFRIKMNRNLALIPTEGVVESDSSTICVFGEQSEGHEQEKEKFVDTSPGL
jgi:hypothetical protein